MDASRLRSCELLGVTVPVGTGPGVEEEESESDPAMLGLTRGDERDCFLCVEGAVDMNPTTGDQAVWSRAPGS